MHAILSFSLVGVGGFSFWLSSTSSPWTMVANAIETQKGDLSLCINYRLSISEAKKYDVNFDCPMSVDWLYPRTDYYIHCHWLTASNWKSSHSPPSVISPSVFRRANLGKRHHDHKCRMRVEWWWPVNVVDGRTTDFFFFVFNYLKCSWCVRVRARV